MKGTVFARALAATVFSVLAIALTVLALRAEFVGRRAGKADADYIRSVDCRVCHEDHFASWRRTHHGRMTQDALPSSVQGDFTRENSLEYQGVKAEMTTQDGSFFMDLSHADGRRDSFRIERTVGSRRIEQYLTRQNDQYFRLPFAYDLIARRWISLNGAFFYPDGGDSGQHWTQWDTNCVFCHNVKAQPNYNFETRAASTEVNELGIACGACHGAGAAHAEAASSPLTRAMWRLVDDSPTHIVDPLELDTDRSMMICGHCHGQRVPEPVDRIREIMSRGDPYDAGEDLAAFYRPVSAHTQIGNLSFANRFWGDGSPRLTAYEYQGIISSACFLKSQKGARINCSTCHTMHDGDVKGQITQDMRTNAACTQCHTDLTATAALRQHTAHEVASTGSSCYACHMPEVVYGVQTIHKTHLISVPEPALASAKGVPNACNQCHIDKSVAWAVENTRRIWPTRYASSVGPTDPQFSTPEGIRGLFAGDALTRALMADALRKHSDLNWSGPFLVEAFATDNYPIVRYFAANALAAWRPSLPKPDYLASNEARAAQISGWIEAIEASRMTDARRMAADLRRFRRDVDLEVGE